MELSPFLMPAFVVEVRLVAPRWLAVVPGAPRPAELLAVRVVAPRWLGELRAARQQVVTPEGQPLVARAEARARVATQVARPQAAEAAVAVRSTLGWWSRAS